MKKRLAFFLVVLTLCMNMFTAYAAAVATPSEASEDMEPDEAEAWEAAEDSYAPEAIPEGVETMAVPSEITLDDYVNYRYDTFSPEELEEIETWEAASASPMMEDIPTTYSGEVTGDVSPVSVIADLLMDSGMKISKATAQGLYDELRSWVAAHRFSKEMVTFSYVALSGQVKTESLRPIELEAEEDFFSSKKSLTFFRSIGRKDSVLTCPDKAT